MSGSPHPAPPFSPILLAGLVLRPLPAAALRPLLRTASHAIERRHPDAFARLGVLDGTLIVIDPVDLPFCLAIAFTAAGHDLRIAEADDRAAAAATIRGPLLALIDLMEGRLDGDAMFFSRELVIEGDIDAVLMLRNTLDGANIDVIGDLASGLGPFARPALALAGGAQALFAHLARDLETLHAAIVAPLARQSAAQEAALRRLEEKIVALEGRVGRRGGRRAATPAGHGR